MDLYDEIIRLRRLGQKCALATIVQVRGSIPSYESAKLLVREDGSMAGTIGGGCVEAEVWAAAREVIEPELPQPGAIIFGAGHISKSLSKVAQLAGFRTTIVDDREMFANSERFPEA